MGSRTTSVRGARRARSNCEGAIRDRSPASRLGQGGRSVKESSVPARRFAASALVRTSEEALRFPITRCFAIGYVQLLPRVRPRQRPLDRVSHTPSFTVVRCTVSTHLTRVEGTLCGSSSFRHPASVPTTPQNTLRLSVHLVGIFPQIWREIEVPAAAHLGSLHNVLQTVMGWTDSHLHEFAVDGARYACPDLGWVGGSFDPAAFDRRAVNDVLAQIPLD